MEPTFQIEDVHIVSVSDHRRLAVFVDGIEHIISQRSIANHKKLVGLLQAVKYSIDLGSPIKAGEWLAKKIVDLLEDENEAV